MSGNLPNGTSQSDIDAVFSSDLPAWAAEYLEIMEERKAHMISTAVYMKTLLDRSKYLPMPMDFDGTFAALEEEISNCDLEIKHIDQTVTDYRHFVRDKGAQS